jgi:hypothetical protein
MMQYCSVLARHAYTVRTIPCQMFNGFPKNTHRFRQMKLGSTNISAEPSHKHLVDLTGKRIVGWYLAWKKMKNLPLLLLPLLLLS